MKKLQQYLTQQYISDKGWEKSTWYGDTISYIHKKFNIENDDFFVEMNVFGEYVEIFEENNHFGKERIFRGILKTNDDLDKIMELLEFDFEMKDNE